MGDPYKSERCRSDHRGQSHLWNRYDKSRRDENTSQLRSRDRYPVQRSRHFIIFHLQPRYRRRRFVRRKWIPSVMLSAYIADVRLRDSQRVRLRRNRRREGRKGWTTSWIHMFEGSINRKIFKFLSSWKKAKCTRKIM